MGKTNGSYRSSTRCWFRDDGSARGHGGFQDHGKRDSRKWVRKHKRRPLAESTIVNIGAHKEAKQDERKYSKMNADPLARQFFCTKKKNRYGHIFKTLPDAQKDSLEFPKAVETFNFN